MIQTLGARRVHPLTTGRRSTLLCTSPEMKQRRGPWQGRRRSNPSIASTRTRGRNTLSIPAHAADSTPPQRHPDAGVTHPPETRDHAALLAAASSNEAISDRALRVYTAVVVSDAREVSAAAIAATLPSLTEAQAGRLLGDLTSAGLLRKRLRTVGYRDGNRVRRSAYSLPDEGVQP